MENTFYKEYPYVVASKKDAYGIYSGYSKVMGAINGRYISASLSSGWHHVALTYDGSTQKLFVDGKLEDSNSFSTSINTNTNDLIIGNNIKSKIDEVRIWNTALDITDIRTNMCKELAGTESGLVAYYKMTDGSGTSLTDNSTNSNTGTLNNMDDSDWVTSGAALGDASTYDYSTPSSVNLASSFGDDVTVGTITGSPDGVQIYRVDSAPNVTTPPTGLDQLSEWHYFGVFIAGGTSPTYTLTYNYDGHPGISNEDNLELVSRSNNAATSWTDLNATLDTGANTLTKTGQTGTEYILGSSGENPLPVILSTFYAIYSGGSPTIYWATEWEEENQGWNIYRGENADALINNETITINPTLIPGAGTTQQVTNYQFVDEHPIVEGNTYWYWLESVDTSGITEIHPPTYLTIPINDDPPPIPEFYGLYQNYPNPFNPDTEIKFKLEEGCYGKIVIYNLKGEKIRTLFKDNINSNEIISVTWNGKDKAGKEVSSGLYFYQLETAKKNYMKKMLLVK